MRALLGMGLLSAAMLLLQVALTRVFSITQFYHFAFLVISLALLGFGASGSALSLWPRLRRQGAAPWYALGFALSAVLAYLFVNHLPFDSYAIAWDRTQVYLLVGNLLGLAVPFTFAGALIGLLLSAGALEAGRIYGANLVGSAAGAGLAPLLIAGLGSERVVLLCAGLGAASALILAGWRASRAVVLALGGLAAAVALLVAYPPGFEAQPSPYKRLSQLRLDPDTAILATHQNAYARLDIVQSPTIHSAPGLSLTYLGELPPQVGLLIDGDALLLVVDARRAPERLARALPAAVAYNMRPQPPESVLVLGSGGNLDPWTALMHGAGQVTVVEPNRLVYDALRGELHALAGLADNPRVTLVHEEIRTYAQQSGRRFDLVHLALTDNYRPITSGAFTLTENYTLTVEAFRAYLGLAGEEGVLVVTRWLQTPPSESLRTLGLILEALGGRDPLQHIVAFRSFQTATFIVKPRPFTLQEVDALLAGIERLRYDLVLAPRMPEEMINRYARLESPVYHELFLALATTPDRAAFYADYEFDVTPPTDNRPFFNHFFRWRQTPEVLQNLGRRWQPFGGSGYFVLIALLGFAVLAALAFVLLPIGARARFRLALAAAGRGRSARALGYFTALGLAFLLVEVSLIQRYILALGQPTLAVATVIGALLLASGLGSAASRRFPLRWRAGLVALALLLAVYPPLTERLTPLLLPLPVALRVLAVAALIAPVGFLMGMPFPRGVARLAETPDLVPWAWAANGSASVISAVLAVTLALSWGFTAVLLVGGGLYLLAAGLATRG